MARSKPKRKGAAKSKAIPKPRISAAEKARRAELVAYERERKLAVRLRKELLAAERAIEERADRDREARIRAERAPAAKPRRKAAQKSSRKAGKGKATKPAALARKPWAGLRKAEKAELRSWRAKKGWTTRTDRENSALAERLSGEHGKEERDRAREELRSGGTRSIAQWLRKTKKLSVRETRAIFAFWFYSP